MNEWIDLFVRVINSKRWKYIGIGMNNELIKQYVRERLVEDSKVKVMEGEKKGKERKKGKKEGGLYERMKYGISEQTDKKNNNNKKQENKTRQKK